MCGIAGIVNDERPNVDVLRSNLNSLQSSLRHRGPDDHGQFFSPDGHAGLVHTRLSILDLTSAGRQPMLSQDGRYAITFNGEIYNYVELRREMQSAGETFRTRTDTEVLLRLYEREGQDCLKRLRGMFAFGIWDNCERTLFLARDTFGIKPLYYYPARARFSFASELRALIDAGLVPRRLSPSGVAGYFRHGSVPEPETLLEGVRCLRAGHALLWRQGCVHEYEYDCLEFTRAEGIHPNAAREVRAALEDSVEHHFRSDVPVGIFLSGGIDSTALLALASRKRRDIRTFCIRFAEQELDEGSLAHRTASHFKSSHSEWCVNGSKTREMLPLFLTSVDQPTIDGFNTFVVSRFARDQGLKVVLSGVGGDELFGGYPTFVNVPRLVDVGRTLHFAPTLAKVAAASLRRYARKPSLRRLGSFLERPPSISAAYHAHRAIFASEEAERLSRGYTGVRKVLPSVWAPDRTTVIENQISALEIAHYMRNQLLRDSDVMSMVAGLELRTPFVDRELFRQVAKIPAHIRLRSGKKLLLAAVPEIPHWIANQPKRGFVFPFQRWLDREWKDIFFNTNSRFGVQTSTWYQRWAVVVFESWCRVHDVEPIHDSRGAA